MAAAVPSDPFAALPLSVAFNILARLPLSLRLRCAEVCRGWRAVLSEPSFWANLDLADDLCVAMPEEEEEQEDEEDERTHLEEITTLAADVASHETLVAWRLMRVPLDGPAEVLEAVVAAAIARQLQTLELIDCSASPACVPALVRLLRDGPALTSLAVACFIEEAARAPLLDVPSAAALWQRRCVPTRR
jgi:hypothetical protein